MFNKVDLSYIVMGLDDGLSVNTMSFGIQTHKDAMILFSEYEKTIGKVFSRKSIEHPKSIITFDFNSKSKNGDWLNTRTKFFSPWDEDETHLKFIQLLATVDK